MSLSIVKILQKNPNGRSGCACSPHGRRADCTPPYACFTATEAMDPRNPVLVVGFKCLQTAMTKASRSPQGAAELRRQNPTPPHAPAPEPSHDIETYTPRAVTFDEAVELLRISLLPGAGE